MPTRFGYTFNGGGGIDDNARAGYRDSSPKADGLASSKPYCSHVRFSLNQSGTSSLE
ncbi:hypothetical protein [Acaryochloris marina]|uniref:hypothetical protein n=1 Tax=Acaryochloris marina TaxID=155978 RepID=UPI00164FC79E|nr:hypothetical protein [Acaryochloris marina]